MRKPVVLSIVVIIAIFGVYLWKTYGGIFKANAPAKENIVDLINIADQSPKPGENKSQLPLKIPDGYSLSVLAKDLVNPRDLILDPKGTVLTSITSQGKVVALPNGSAKVVADGLNRPHGLAFDKNKLFIAETDKVSVYDYNPITFDATNKTKILDLPGNGFHFTRSLIIKDGRIYASIGSSCNVCLENDKRRASIWSSNLDGSDFKPFATGLRNSVFMTLNPSTNEIWSTDMGRDYLGDDLPPDEINIIREGQFYGWPYCWGDGISDKDENPGGSKFDCTKSTNPFIKIQAHSAPLGLAFLGKDLLVAYHGSWNRSVPTGYKVVLFKNGNQEDFITGWLSNGSVLGRPVDILVKGNDIYISDDKAGAVYLLKKL